MVARNINWRKLALTGRSTTKYQTGQGLKDIPIAILATSRQNKDVKFCLEAGACDFRTKPVEFDEWIETLTNLAGAYRQT